MKNIKIGEAYAYLVPYLQPIQYQDKMPTVLVCPGGAYFYTSQREAEPVAHEFLAKGYNVFVLHYSTMSTKRMVEEGLDYEASRTKIEDVILQSEDQPAQFPLPLIELGLAMKHIHDYADDYHVDVDNIICCGFSAGANLVSLLGVYWNSKWLNDLLGTKDQVLKPKAQILAYGYMNSLGLFKSQIKELLEIEEAMIKATFNTLSPSEEDLISVSPELLMHKDVPATFLWHTREDDLVPVEQSINFSIALQKHKIPWEMHIFDRGDHGLSVASRSSMSENKHAYQWVGLADSWLKTYYIKER